MTNIKDYLTYYKNKLERIKDDEETILETIHKLSKPTVTAEVLQDTGIYKSLYKLTKRKGKVADHAIPLFNKWKLLLSIAMKEKDTLKKISSMLENPPPSARPRPDSTRNDSKRQPPGNDNFVPDSTQEANMSHRSRGMERGSRGHPKEHLEPNHSISIDRGSRRQPMAPEVKDSRNPPHRSSDSDSDRGNKPGKKDDRRSKGYFAPVDGSANEPKIQANKQDYFAPVEDTTFSNRSTSSAYASAPKELVVPEPSGTCSSKEETDSTVKDCAPDTTRPSSGSSEHNGVCYSQDSNHLDIDSLCNPNLNIDGPQSDRLNSSDDLDSSPTKGGKILEPYHIEMKEGMFRVVRTTNYLPGTSHIVFEQIHREIMKNDNTHTYRKVREKYEEPRCNEATPLKKSPGEQPANPKFELTKKPEPERSGKDSSDKSRSDLKRKSDSPLSKGVDKRMKHDVPDNRASEKRICPDSTSDFKLKIKKDDKSPSPAYKPVNNAYAHQSHCDRNKITKTRDSPETAMEFISSKKERRSIYSGKKCVQDISTLQSSCMRFLRKNLDCLRYPMRVPYEILHPILETLNPSQLAKIEEMNQYLLADTNQLWKQHFNRDYRNVGIMKNEKDVKWKDEYNRAHDQQKKKLKNLTASINAAASKAKPDRQAKLTLVDSQHDPLRRRTKATEVPVVSLKPTNPANGPKSLSPALGHRSTSPAVSLKTSLSPTAKPSSAPKPSMPVIVKPKDVKHLPAHKPVKKVVAPLMSKVKKSMGIVYRQK